MSFTTEGIFQKIMEKVVDDAKESSDTPSHMLRFHVSQTADQLPDIRKRNAYYRTELEKQIQDKKEADRKRKERELLEEERLIRKIEADREKLKREYLDEIRQRELLQEETIRKQQLIARRLEEIQEVEERKREEELKKRQAAAAAAKRIAELEEAIEKKRLEEIEKRKQLAAFERLYYWDPVARDYFKNGYWNSRDYVNSALGGAVSSGGGGGGRELREVRDRSLISGSLDDVYFAAPLPILADVYRRLVYEKTRIKDVIKERIRDGEG